MIPIGASPIQNSKRRAPGLIGQDLLVRPSIHNGWQMKTMPVCGGRRPTKVIRYIDNNLVSVVDDQSRSKQITVVSKRGCLFSRKELCRSRLHYQIIGHLPIDQFPIHHGWDMEIR